MKNIGVCLLFFDLPVTTKEHIKEYTRFIKCIKKEGYMMIQESLYLKALGNIKIVNDEIKRVRKITPSEGKINVLPLTYQQFSKMVNILGERIDINFDPLIIG